MTKKEELMGLLQNNHGYLKTAEALRFVSKAYLGEFVKKYGLERVAHGLYMSQDAWDDGIYVLQTRYPEAVFSHETALYLLKIADREPTKFSLTLRAGANSSGLSKQGVKVYKVKDDLFTKGLMEIQTPAGHVVRGYNPERTICDLFRVRRKIEIQELQAAVKEYVRRKDKNLPLLMRYAKAFSIEKFVRQYLEVLL